MRGFRRSSKTLDLIVVAELKVVLDVLMADLCRCMVAIWLLKTLVG